MQKSYRMVGDFLDKAASAPHLEQLGAGQKFLIEALDKSPGQPTVAHRLVMDSFCYKRDALKGGAIQEFLKKCYIDSGGTFSQGEATRPMMDWLGSFRNLGCHKRTASILWGIYGVRFALTGEFDVVID